LRIDRTERELARDAAKLADQSALDHYLADARDTASPRALAGLIVKLAAGHLIQPRLTLIALDLMRRTKSGDDRMKSGMLPGWTFAHRAGTARGVEGTMVTFHDMGLATSKKDVNIALSLLVERATLSPAALAQFHRAVARAVLEAWG
jgi:beta-lactamase class A